MMKAGERRAPIRGIGVMAARRVREAIGYAHPNELEIEVLAFMRGAQVRSAGATGARANLLRLGKRGVIGVADNLGFEERRWAVAHELGHFEAHAGVSFVGLCQSRDMLAAYEASGREPEANAFAAELLMPEDLFVGGCDVPTVSWGPVRALAEQFSVSVTAAALRFVACTDERVCIVCARNGVVEWTYPTRNFGPRPRKGSRIQPWTESHDFFTKGTVEATPQTVSASAWIDGAGDDDNLVEHLFPISRLGIAMSMLWWKES